MASSNSMGPITSPSSSPSHSPSAATVSFQESSRLLPSPPGPDLLRQTQSNGRMGSMAWTTSPVQSPSAGTLSFRESTYLIPSPGFDGKLPKRFDNITLSWPVVVGVPLCLLVLGFALEVAVIICKERNGWKVPRISPFLLVTPQFVLSFLPVLVVIPFALMWRELDWKIRWFQPYVALQKGNALAEESLLLDYVALGPFMSLFRSRIFDHRMVFWSSLVAVATYSFQPLAGSIFVIRDRVWTRSTSVTSIKSTGLLSNVDQLAAFVAASGFTDAAIYNKLPDPRFINSPLGWAIADFTFPSDKGNNGTISVNTTGVLSTPNCANPVSLNVIRNTNSTVTVSTQSVDGCNVTYTLDPTLSSSQYNVTNIPCPGNAATTPISLQPVMFWIYNNNTDGSPQVQTIFCTPSIQISNVQVSYTLDDGKLKDVKRISGPIASNNVTGGGLQGRAYNSVVFTRSTDPVVQARAIATGSSVAGAIFRFASQQPGGPQSVFGSPNGFLEIASNVYRLQLSMSALSVYFVKQNSTVPAVMKSSVSVLWLDPLPAHLLAILLVLAGLAGIFVQVFHQLERRKLLLAAPPGSIASIMSLTSRSGFGELLLPYDDAKTLERKLGGMRFRLDDRTGAILADVSGESRGMSMGRDAAMASLLGNKAGNQDTIASSSLAAYQAALAGPRPLGNE